MAHVAEAVTQCHHHSFLGGFMVGLSSLTPGTYHPALAQEDLKSKDRDQPNRGTGFSIWMENLNSSQSKVSRLYPRRQPIGNLSIFPT
ncbi:MAG TPA: hypothetical protein DD706_02235 [Nitrospiraceae bacterium]|nr:hypothetical protein [Nitrospiraceae bacterium]